MNRTFISSREVINVYFMRGSATHEIDIFFTSLDEISHIHDKMFWIYIEFYDKLVISYIWKFKHK